MPVGGAGHAKASVRMRPEWLRSSDESTLEVRQLACVTAAVVGLHLLPRLLLGRHTHFTLHDNLDSDMLFRVLIARDHRMFAPNAIIPEIFGGLPRWDYPSPFKLGSMLFWLLPTFWAYITLEAVVRAFAVAGMGLLLRDYVPAPRAYRLAIAATFGILPFYTIYDLSVAGEPLVAWALLNLLHGRRIRGSLMVCAVYPFASILWTGAPFFLALAAGYIALHALRAGRMPRYAAAGFVVIAAGYLVADQAGLAGLLRAEFVSQRSVLGPVLDARAGWAMLLGGHYNAATLHTPILITTLYLIPFLFGRDQPHAARMLSTMLALAAFCSFSEQSWFLQVLQPLYKRASWLHEVNIRFSWSLPLIWYVTLALVALYWSNARLPGRVLNVLLAVQFAWVFAAPNWAPGSFYPELRTNYVMLFERLLGRKPRLLGYAEFMSEKAFAQIRKRIGADTGRVISIGMHPAIAAYNGLPCADGVHDNYPLSYKLRFRRMIARELARDKHRSTSIDRFGSSLYVTVREFKNDWYDEPQPRPPHVLRRLDLDEAALHDLGVKWVVSALKFKAGSRPALLIDRGTFGDAAEGYRLSLYRVRDPVPDHQTDAPGEPALAQP
jgi:hypothetical protein